jgi:hypothetical protein
MEEIVAYDQEVKSIVIVIILLPWHYPHIIQ